MMTHHRRPRWLKAEVFGPGAALSALRGRHPLTSSSAPLKGEVLFREEQGFGWPWPGMLIVVVGVVVFLSVDVTFAIGVWQQLVEKHPWGTKPMPDGTLAGVAFLSFLVSLLPLFVLKSRLLVEVRTDGLSLRLRPFLRAQVIPRDQVRAARLAEVRGPGWGVHRLGGTAIYRMAGREAVELELVHGKVKIGTERRHRLLEAVRTMLEG
jgi:hypothetical protein